MKRSPFKATLNLSLVYVLKATKSKRGITPFISPVLGIFDIEIPNPKAPSSKFVFLR